MLEKETPHKPKPDILTKPFAKGLHPYTMMFLFLAYDEGAYEWLTQQHLKVFDSYFVGDKTIEKQKSDIFKDTLAAFIIDGFDILRINVSKKLSDAFTSEMVPFFKEKDIPYVKNSEIESKKLRYANQSIGLLGKKRTEESKEKMRQSKIGKPQSEATRLKRREQMKKLWENPEYRKKMGKISQDKWKDKVYREKQIKRRTGIKLSEETKQKVREANTGKIRSQETRDKIALKKKGLALSPETKAKISASLKGRRFSEETKLNMKKAAILREQKKRDKFKNISF